MKSYENTVKNKWLVCTAQESCWWIHARAHDIQHIDKWSRRMEQVALSKLLTEQIHSEINM